MKKNLKKIFLLYIQHLNTMTYKRHNSSVPAVYTYRIRIKCKDQNSRLIPAIKWIPAWGK